MTFCKKILYFCLSFVACIRISSFQETESSLDVPSLTLDNLHLTLSSKLLVDIYSPGARSLKGYLGWLPNRKKSNYTRCSDEGTLCLAYDSGMKLTIRQESEGHCEQSGLSCGSVTCHRVRWLNHIGGAMDCFLMGEHEWYGGGVDLNQKWPLQSSSKSWHPTVTGDPLHHLFGSIVENTWFSSNGFVIHVEDTVPLFVNFNESGSGKLCFTTSSTKYPYEKEEHNEQELAYSVCSGMSLKDIYMHTVRKWYKATEDIPEENVFRYPIWSTWAKFKSSVNQTTTLQFGRDIQRMEFPVSQLEIDDRWEQCYGSLDFDSEKFPDPLGMAKDMNDMGFVTSLWVHPFCNMDCEVCMSEENREFWVKDKAGKILEIQWWNGDSAAAVDFTNKDAVNWMIKRLLALKNKYGIHSFKFDAGEAMWLHPTFLFNDTSAASQPNLYSKAYAEMAAGFGTRVEVRTGWKTQNLPVFVRMYDKFSRWGYDNGLKTIIPNALQMSVIGYHFILPDMIGGNNYDTPEELPDRELYIRWLESTVFLPVLQFSIAPWDYDEEVVAIAKDMIDLHERYSSIMINLAKQSTLTGEPIIRPLWWLSPDDKEALRIDSQFLLGDDILVAPVLEKGERHRNIYLPEGKWTDVQRGNSYDGAQWLYSYPAPLNFLPFFIRNY